MSKLLQAILSGMFFTFILDFFLILGIQLNYLEANNIKIYYNVFFADNQNIYIFALMTLFLGFCVTFIKSHKTSLVILLISFIFPLSTLFAPIGERVGKIFFLSDTQNFEIGKFKYSGEIYYVGRDHIYFYDHNSNEMIKIEKKRVINKLQF